MKSKKGFGSNFMLAFPVKACREVIAFSKSFEEDEKQEQFKGKTFLLLDDIPENTFLMREVLLRHGITSITAQNGHEALDIYKNSAKKIDMIVTDLRMPVMSGQTFILEVRKYEAEIKKKRTPIIVVTAENSVEEKKMCLTKYGADEYLVKPIKYQDFIYAIGKVYANKRREKSRSILVLDDDAVSARFLSTILTQNGHKCVVKSSLAEAKEYFKNNASEHDIILLDNFLGDGTGLDFIEYTDKLAKENEPAQQPLIISISGNSIPDQRELYKGARVSGFLQKPIKKQDLLDLLYVL